MKYISLTYLTYAILFTGIFHILNPAVQAQNTPSAPPEGTYQTGEFIIQFEPGNTPKDIDRAVQIREDRAESIVGKLQNTQETLRLSLLGQDTPEEIQNNFTAAAEAFDLTTAKPVPQLNNTYIYSFADTTSPQDIQKVVEMYEDLPITYIQPNYTYYLNVIPNDPEYAKQWGLQRIKSELGWDLQKGSSTIKVAIVDSGIDRNHPELSKNVIKSMPIAPGCINDGDSNGHGTHVAGIIGASTNNSAVLAGLNWDVTLMGYCVVSPSGVGTSVSIAQGVQQAIKDGAHVINLSLGGPILPGMDRSVEDAIKDASAKGITIVSAAGNCGHLPPGQYPNNPECFWGGDADKYMPGADPRVINVAAIGPNNEHPKYSNYGSTIAVSAPGGNPPSGSVSCNLDGSDCIVSTWDRFKPCPQTGSIQSTCSLSGTSMAAPHVTGLVALLKAQNPALAPSHILNIINSTADDLGTNHKDPLFGYGRIDVIEALQRALGTNPTTRPSPTTPTDSCATKKQKGDYNCNGIVNLGDFESWRQDFSESKATLTEFEWFRAGFSDTVGI